MVNDKLLGAQSAILGSMLIDESIIGEVVAEVKSDDFLNETYRHVYEAIRTVYFARGPVDAVTVLHQLGAPELYQKLLAELMEVTPTSANWRAYAQVLHEEARICRVQELGQQLMAAVGLDDATATMQQLSNILIDKVDTRIVSFADGYKQFYQRFSEGKKPDYLRWGFSALNDRLYVEGGDLVIIGARPSAGKTMLAAQFGLTMARAGKRIGIFSLETSDQKLYDRMMSFVADVDYGEIKRGQLTDDSWEKIAEASRCCELPLDVINASGMTVSDIRAISLSRHYDVVFVDYLQIIRPSRKSCRVDEVTDISMELQQFAKSSGTTVIALSQFSRAPKVEANKMPTMQDLRESGQIEQDADVIMLLWAFDNDDPKSDRGLFIAKNKEGELGRITLGFRPEHMTFFYKSTRTDEPKPKPQPQPQPKSKPDDDKPFQANLFEFSQPFEKPEAQRRREEREIFGD